MIKNDKQLKLTKERLLNFSEALTKLEADTDMHSIKREIQINALRNDIRQFEKEIWEYEQLKSGQQVSLHIPEFRLCYEALIKARIAKGWSQEELAEKVGLKGQQIQRYEATNYSTASLPRIVEIIYALGINISMYVTGLSKTRFNLPEGVAEEEVVKSQMKLKLRRVLLAV